MKGEGVRGWVGFGDWLGYEERDSRRMSMGERRVR